MKARGSRAEVMHGTARRTSGGLRKQHLKYNKRGKIVSKRASARATKENRLVKAGYKTKKGQFGSFKNGTHVSGRRSRRKSRRKQRGGVSNNSGGSTVNRSPKPPPAARRRRATRGMTLNDKRWVKELAEETARSNNEEGEGFMD